MVLIVEKVVSELWHQYEIFLIIKWEGYGHEDNTLERQSSLISGWRRGLNDVERGSGNGPNVPFPIIVDWILRRDLPSYQPTEEDLTRGKFGKGLAFTAFVIGRGGEAVGMVPKANADKTRVMWPLAEVPAGQWPPGAKKNSKGKKRKPVQGKKIPKKSAATRRAASAKRKKVTKKDQGEESKEPEEAKGDESKSKAKKAKISKKSAAAKKPIKEVIKSVVNPKLVAALVGGSNSSSLDPGGGWASSSSSTPSSSSSSSSSASSSSSSSSSSSPSSSSSKSEELKADEAEPGKQKKAELKKAKTFKERMKAVSHQSLYEDGLKILEEEKKNNKTTPVAVWDSLRTGVGDEYKTPTGKMQHGAVDDGTKKTLVFDSKPQLESEQIKQTRRQRKTSEPTSSGECTKKFTITRTINLCGAECLKMLRLEIPADYRRSAQIKCIVLEKIGEVHQKLTAKGVKYDNFTVEESTNMFVTVMRQYQNMRGTFNLNIKHILSKLPIGPDSESAFDTVSRILKGGHLGIKEVRGAYGSSADRVFLATDRQVRLMLFHLVVRRAWQRLDVSLSARELITAMTLMGQLTLTPMDDEFLKKKKKRKHIEDDIFQRADSLRLGIVEYRAVIMTDDRVEPLVSSLSYVQAPSGASVQSTSSPSVQASSSSRETASAVTSVGTIPLIVTNQQVRMAALRFKLAKVSGQATQQVLDDMEFRSLQLEFQFADQQQSKVKHE